MAKKITPVKYTSRDFNSIKRELVEYVKRYYPDTYKDFNEASFGAMMLDTVAYVGDQLSFYLDYQASESFLDTSAEFDNIVRLGRTYGYKFNGSAAAHGLVEMFIVVAANVTGLSPKTGLLPMLKRGSEFSTDFGTKFTLTHDVDFSLASNEIVVARVNSTTGLPTHYAVKAVGRVISGELATQKITIGNFEKFLRIRLAGRNIIEILSVTDTDGHEWNEVDYLSQDVVYRAIPNRNSDKELVSAILKPVAVPRRFIVENESEQTFLQFGYGSDTEIKDQSIADAADVILDKHGRNYITDKTFDPSKLISTDKFGVAPANTTLTIIYRINSFSNINAAANSIVKVTNPIFRFDDLAAQTPSEVRGVVGSLEVNNENPIFGDVSLPNSAELKRRIYDSYASQNRAVTANDYKAVIYRMPPEFGSVKRATIMKDSDSFKRNLNLYLISEDANGKLISTNETIKTNVRTWITRYKMINDTIDILDGRIVNLGINFSVIADLNFNKFDILVSSVAAIKKKLDTLPDFGEPFMITDIYDALRDAEGVADVVSVKVTNKHGNPYSSLNFDVVGNRSADGRMIIIPETYIWEIRNFDTDIKGVVK